MLQLVLALLPAYFRHFPVTAGKKAVWENVVLKRLFWRRLELTATSTFGARFEVHLPDMIQSYLYFFGVWEPVITKYISDRLRDGDVFIDVGANIGYYSLLASRCVGAKGRVFAIEPASNTYAMLQRNIKRNGASNVTAIQVAVSDTEQQVPIWSNRNGDSAGTTTLTHVAERRLAMSLVETVTARPLHDIIDPDLIRKARFIKIDVEGAEWAVVKSLAELLKTLSPETEVIIEVNAALVQRSGGTLRALLGTFAEAGLQPFVIANDYDVAFIGRKVQEVRLKPLGQWNVDQLDLVFRRREAEARAP